MIFGGAPFGSSGFAAWPFRPTVPAEEGATLLSGGGYVGSQAVRVARPDGWDDDPLANQINPLFIHNQNLALIHMLMGLAATGALQ